MTDWGFKVVKLRMISPHSFSVQMPFVPRTDGVLCGWIGNLSHSKSHRLWDSVAPTALHLGEHHLPSAARWTDMLRSCRAYITPRTIIFRTWCTAQSCSASTCIAPQTIIIRCWYAPQKCLAETYSVHHTIILWHLYALQCVSFKASFRLMNE